MHTFQPSFYFFTCIKATFLLVVMELSMSTNAVSQNMSKVVSTQAADTFHIIEDLAVPPMIFFPPMFRGGGGLMYWIDKTIHYPEGALKDGIEGLVTVTFVVNKEGKVTHAKVLKGASKELDAEALRVVREMPNWYPAISETHNAEAKVALFFTFESSGKITCRKSEGMNKEVFADYYNIDKSLVEPADFYGGRDSLDSYLLKKMNSSSAIKDSKLSLLIFIQLYIDEKGRVIGEDIYIDSHDKVKSNTEQLKIRKVIEGICKHLPAFKPAKIRDGAVKVLYSNICFSLDGKGTMRTLKRK